jgi:hypothetical protein
MLFLGWGREQAGEHPLSWATLAFWILPVGEPPGSDRAMDLWEPLWYVRAYLWFVVLSPLMYRVYRRIGWFAVAAPIVVVAVLVRTGFTLPDTADAAMWDFVTYGACWIAGFAHHDGRLARTRPVVVAGAAAVLGAGALYWLNGHPGEGGFDLNEVAESQALWSIAVVLLVLRWQPPMTWLARIRPLDATVTLLNNRAVTVYLWHNIAIIAVWPVLTIVALDDLGGWGNPIELVTALILTGATILAFGWAEDLAARRRPALWPTSTKAAGTKTGGTKTAGTKTAGAETPGAEAGAAAGPPAAEMPTRILPKAVLRHAGPPLAVPVISPPVQGPSLPPPPRARMVFPAPPWDEPVRPPSPIPWSGHDPDRRWPAPRNE